jgi:hypothetical protein
MESRYISEPKVRYFSALILDIIIILLQAPIWTQRFKIRVTSSSSTLTHERTNLTHYLTNTNRTIAGPYLDAALQDSSHVLLEHAAYRIQVCADPTHYLTNLTHYLTNTNRTNPSNPTILTYAALESRPPRARCLGHPLFQARMPADAALILHRRNL